MTDYKDIPIEVAQEIAEKFHKNQVIILAWDKNFGKCHVSTFGKSQIDARQAAEGGNRLKKAIGWPDKQCRDKPRRKEDHDDEKDIMYNNLKLIAASRNNCLEPHIIALETIRKITGKAF